MQRHVMADYKPYLCNAQGVEEYDVTSPTAL